MRGCFIALAVALASVSGAWAEDGAALVARFECNRCHEADLWAPAEPNKQCLGCHQRILAGDFPGAEAHLARWQARLTSLNAVPSLRAVGQRFKRSWLVAFLSAPEDLRPALPAMMPRFAFAPGEAAALAAYLAPEDPAPSEPLPGDPARGRARFGALGCGLCHAFTGADLPTLQPPTLPPAVLQVAVPLAPDLRITRARFQPHRLAAWIRNPIGIKADTVMPTLPMSAEDAQDLATWILTAPLAPQAPPVVPPLPPPLQRKVAWPEVEARVFKHICWHCHSEPAFALGDGGPGNTGGFGFPGRGLNLASYAGISSGLLDATTHTRSSVFAPGPDGTPLLVLALWARHWEVAGQPIPGVRGMPLGLPPLPMEDIQRVLTWVAQGRPR